MLFVFFFEKAATRKVHLMPFYIPPCEDKWIQFYMEVLAQYFPPLIYRLSFFFGKLFS